MDEIDNIHERPTAKASRLLTWLHTVNEESGRMMAKLGGTEKAEESKLRRKLREARL